MDKDRIVSVSVLALSVWYLHVAFQIPERDVSDAVGPRMYPYIVGTLLAIAAVTLFIQALRSSADAKRREVNKDEHEGEHRDVPSGIAQYAVVGGVLLWSALFIAVFEELGFLIATSGFTYALMMYFNRGRWLMNGASAVGFSLIAYVVLAKMLGATLAPGLLSF